MRTDLNGQFDIVLCCENIEHVLYDGFETENARMFGVAGTSSILVLMIKNGD